MDSNQRRLTPTGLQPVPFSHSGTDPDISTNLNLVYFLLALLTSEILCGLSFALFADGGPWVPILRLIAKWGPLYKADNNVYAGTVKPM